MKRVVVFDSGVGGKMFADELKRAIKGLKVELVHDTAHMPYGDKTPREIRNFTELALARYLNTTDRDIIVLACNTATAYSIDYLRSKYRHKTFIGFEPAIKTGRGLSQNETIAVLATPATLKSPRYRALKKTYGRGITVYEPNVSTLAAEIENREVDWPNLKKTLRQFVNQDVDVFVLGCTHYHLIKNTIANFAGKDARIVTPTQAVIKQIQKFV